MRKQTIFLLTCYSFFLISCGDENTNQVKTSKESEKVVEVTDISTGDIKTVTQDAKGVPNGITTYFDSNRIVRVKEMYVNGRKEGWMEAYDSNGALMYKGFNKNGERDSICKWFYETGEIQRLEYYKTGFQRWDGYYYYQNGEIRTHVFADDSGHVHYKGNYDDKGKVVKSSGVPIFVIWTDKIMSPEMLEVEIFTTANPEFINNCSISLIDSKGNSVDLVRNEAIKEDHSDGFAKRLVVRHKIQDKGNYTVRIKAGFFTSSSPKAKMKYSKDLKVTVE